MQSRRVRLRRKGHEGTSWQKRVAVKVGIDELEL